MTGIFSKFIKVWPVLAIIAITVLVSLTGWLFYQYQGARAEIKAIKNNPAVWQQAQEEEVKRVVDEVSKLMALPEGEQPTIATVSDADKIKGQPFFAKAKIGDKVLIYNNARTIILYDPEAKRIINISDLDPEAVAATAPLQIRILNGTTTSGLTGQIETQIKATNPQANIVAKENAKKNNYDKSVMVVLKDSVATAAASLSTSLGITIGDLPSGEASPDDAEILIIAGKDKTT